jgi:hypothetical protein
MLENTEGIIKKHIQEKLPTLGTHDTGQIHGIAPSVLSSIYLSCVLCTLCCQFLWIVLLHYPFGIL